MQYKIDCMDNNKRLLTSLENGTLESDLRQIRPWWLLIPINIEIKINERNQDLLKITTHVCW